MSARTLAERLVDGSLPGGVYRVSARGEARLASEGESGSAALRWQRLPAPARWTREALLDALAATLAFPEHFGRNWDAAWDCLTELDWREDEEARVIVLPPGAAAPDAAAMAAFVALMQDACEHWARRRRILVALIVEGEGAGEDDTPDWLSGVAVL